MLSSLHSELVCLFCSFTDANTFHSFTLTNSYYNQNQSLYQEYIIKNYSPELFGFPKWDHTIFGNEGVLPNGKSSQRKLQFPGPLGLVPGGLNLKILVWKDLFYRINSKKYLKLCGQERKFPVYFNETILNILQRIKDTCDIDKLTAVSTFPDSDPPGGPVFVISNKKKACASYRYYKKEPAPISEGHQMSSLIGSIITQDKNYLFDRLSVLFVLK
jgi:hypothetical protein